MKTLYFTVSLLLILSSHVLATDRYASPSGSGSAPCTTDSDGGACQLNLAMAALSPGDTLWLRNGNYTTTYFPASGTISAVLATAVNGTSSNRITVRAKNRHAAIIRPASNISGISVRHDYYTFKGIKVEGQNANRYGVYINSGSGSNLTDGTILEDIFTLGTGNVPMFIQGARDTIILYSNFKDGGMSASQCCGEGLYAGSSQTGSPLIVTNLLALGNTWTNVISNGADFKLTTSNNLVTHSIIQDFKKSEDHGQEGGNEAIIQSHGPSGLTPNRFENVIVRNSSPTSVTHGVQAEGGRNLTLEKVVMHNITGMGSSLLTGRTGSTLNVNNSTFCNLNRYNTAGISGSGNQFNVAQSNCDSEVARIISEVAARPVIAQCEIGLIASNKIRCTWINDKFPPLVTVDNTKFSATVAGIGRTINSSILVSGTTNITEHTLASAVTGGQTVLISGTLGAVVNNGLVGDTWISDLASSAAFTDTSVTNNVGGGGATHQFTQKAFQFYKIRTEGGSLVKLPHATAALNTNINVVPGASLILGAQIDGTIANPPSIGVIPYYQKNGTGGYAAIPGSFGVDNVRIGTSQIGSDIPNEGEVISSCLSGALAVVDGLVVKSANAIPTFDLAQDNCIVNRWAIEFDTDVNPTDYYEIQLRNQDGTTLDNYDETPRITIIPERAGGGA